MPKSNILAIIPARAGSKRLPSKNTKLLNGKPLVQWTIDAALKSNVFDEILVSTDSPQIAKIAEDLGLTVPFIRPSNISGDNATSVDVALHALNYYEQQGKSFEYVMLLQPTSPLRQVADITMAVETLEKRSADAIISVCECEHSPLWSNTLGDEGDMDQFLASVENKTTRSQDLPKYYRLNGAIYLVKSDKLIAERNFFISNNVFAYKMQQTHSIDIDTLIDFKMAEILMTEEH